MREIIGFSCYLLSAVGLTVVVIWPDKGISAWIRDRILKALLPVGLRAVLDCYICCSFWSAVVLSPLFWWNYREMWCWCGPLIVPALFWFLLRERA